VNLEPEMENSPKKKRNKNIKYSANNLARAVEDVKEEKLTIYSAAKKHSVPETTLRNRLKSDETKKHGREKVLSDEHENNLIDWALHNAKVGCPLSLDTFMEAAGNLSKLNEDREKRFKNEKPTRTWLAGFMKRHPELSFRKPEALGKASANVSANDCKNFIKIIYDYLVDKELLWLLDHPECWINADETSLPLNPVPNTVIAAKGAKNVYNVESSKAKENVTGTYGFVADGSMIDPMYIFKTQFCSMPDVAYACGGNFVTYLLCVS
jgi:hypothetical protein